MGGACTCVTSENYNGQNEESQNSKFFYYSDPRLLEAFQDKLKGIQESIEAQKKYRDSIGGPAPPNHRQGKENGQHRRNTKRVSTNNSLARDLLTDGLTVYMFRARKINKVNLQMKKK